MSGADTVHGAWALLLPLPQLSLREVIRDRAITERGRPILLHLSLHVHAHTQKHKHSPLKDYTND